MYINKPVYKNLEIEFISKSLQVVSSSVETLGNELLSCCVPTGLGTCVCSLLKNPEWQYGKQYLVLETLFSPHQNHIMHVPNLIIHCPPDPRLYWLQLWLTAECMQGVEGLVCSWLQCSGVATRQINSPSCAKLDESTSCSYTLIEYQIVSYGDTCTNKILVLVILSCARVEQIRRVNLCT